MRPSDVEQNGSAMEDGMKMVYGVAFTLFRFPCMARDLCFVGMRLSRSGVFVSRRSSNGI